jgi:hypothetical protein
VVYRASEPAGRGPINPQGLFAGFVGAGEAGRGVVLRRGAVRVYWGYPAAWAVGVSRGRRGERSLLTFRLAAQEAALQGSSSPSLLSALQGS